MRLSNFIEDCLANSLKNLDKKPKGRRYTDEIKQIATYLYIRGGLSLYEFFSKNMDFPQVITIKRFMDDMQSKLVEGIIYSKQLKEFLVAHNLPLEVLIVEDGTKITEFVEYDLSQNTLIGLVAPLEKLTGMPKPGFFKANTAEQINSAITGAEKASYIQTIIAKANVKGNLFIKIVLNNLMDK